MAGSGNHLARKPGTPPPPTASRRWQSAGSGLQACGDDHCERILARIPADSRDVVLHALGVLVAAGPAMAASCEPCLNHVTPNLIEVGVPDAEIRRAVEVGQDVKDREAGIVKETADKLIGEPWRRLHQSDCPMDPDRWPEAAGEVFSDVVDVVRSK